MLTLPGADLETAADLHRRSYNRQQKVCARLTLAHGLLLPLSVRLCPVHLRIPNTSEQVGLVFSHTGVSHSPADHQRLCYAVTRPLCLSPTPASGMQSLSPAAVAQMAYTIPVSADCSITDSLITCLNADSMVLGYFEGSITSIKQPQQNLQDVWAQQRSDTTHFVACCTHNTCSI